MRLLQSYDEEKMLFYDIETAPVVKELEEGTPLYDSWAYKVNKEGELTPQEVIESYSIRAGLYPEFAKIVSIVVGKIVNGKIALIKIDDFEERDLLSSFNSVLARNPLDTIVGFVNVGFDNPFVAKRMIINGIRPDVMLDCFGAKPWEVKGLDLAVYWKFTSFERASLINITTAFGLPSPKEDIGGADVGRVYWENPKKNISRITEYCARDVVSTVNIFKCMRLEEPLEVMETTKPVEATPVPLLEKLFAGGDYKDEDKEALAKELKSMTVAERKVAFVTLDAVTSTASGKKTKITKAHVKALKLTVNGK